MKKSELLKVLGMVVPLSLSCMTFRFKKLYVFGAWFGEKYTDNSKALYLYCLKNYPHIKAIWITKNRSVYNELKMAGLPVALSFSLKGILCQLHAGVVIYCTSSQDLFSRILGRAVHINLWHGVGGGKKICYDAGMYSSKYDSMIQSVENRVFSKRYYVSTSNVMSNVFKSAFRTNDDHIIMAGQPRNDMFFDHDYKFITINSEQFSKKKIVIYLPTHRLEGKERIDCSSLFDFPLLNEFCQDNNLLFVIKKHFYHKNENEEISAYSNIIDWTQLSGIDTNELLMVSDYLISDYSSVTADYLLLNRPIFYYCYDLENYLAKDRDMYWSYDEITPGPKCRTFDELMSSLKAVIKEEKDEFVAERERVLSMFYGPQARKMVSQDILDEVEKISSSKYRKGNKT